MLKDYTQQIIGTASQFKPRSNAVDWKSIGDSLKSMDTSFKAQDLASALESGDEEAINKAKVALDPEGYAKALEANAQRAEDRQWALEDQATKQRNALELLAQQSSNAFALEKLRNSNDIGLAKLKASLTNGVTDATKAKSLENAQLGVDMLKEIADDGSLGTLNKYNFTDEGQNARGKLSGAIAAIAPMGIQRLKDAGVSGVNTLGEFMTYVGLPQNPTSKEIAGALPIIAQTLGLDNPYALKANNLGKLSDDELLKGL